MASAARVSQAAIVMVAAGVVCGCEPARQPVTPEMLTVRTVGLAHFEEGRLDSAAVEFERLTQIAPREALGFANLGLVRLLTGQFPDAAQQIGRALELDPENPNIRLMQAKLYELTGRNVEARTELSRLVEQHPRHVKALYALAQLTATAEEQTVRAEQGEYLQRVVELMPANLVARLELVEFLVRQPGADAAAMHMEQLRQQIAELPRDAQPYFDDALAHMRAGRAEESLEPTIIFHNFMKREAIYQAGNFELLWPFDSSVTTFSEDISLGAAAAAAVLEAIQFTDVTATVGLDAVPATSGVAPGIALGDYDQDGDTDVYVVARQQGAGSRLLRNDGGRLTDATRDAGVRPRAGETAARFADYDNDGRLDLYVTRAGRNLLYRNDGGGSLRDVTRRAGVGDLGYGHGALFVDVDHDGDLDLYVANGGPNALYRNNVDGTFVEMAGALGIVGGDHASRGAALGDFDDDGDVDLFVVNEDTTNALFSNQRQGRFLDVAQEWGLATTVGSGAAAVGDYDNDGDLDLFVAAHDGVSHRLYANDGDGHFVPDSRADSALATLSGMSGLDATFFDFDNDGHLDLAVAGETGVRLLHNEGAGVFADMSALLPQDLTAAARVAATDFDRDGDLDFFVATAEGLRLLRNDGGNANHYLQLQLVGLGPGSGKNNHFSIGAKLEVRAQDLYQMRAVAEPVTHFGLGLRRQADVVRAVWTNGVPQNWLYRDGDQRLVEQQVLKGSCPFLYAWNGEAYEFVTDLMWRSAIGMPLGIMGAREATYAPPGASQEYVRIPGELLQPRDGVYSLQVTAELWEFIYVDEVQLLVVDHPDAVDVYVDEKFVPPAPAELEVYQVARPRTPVAATDDRGNDLLDALRDPDDVYVANFTPARYQGITQLHDLVLDLGDLSGAERVTLFLRGWIFPTDASINVAMSQTAAVQAVVPSVQVVGRDGTWHTVVPSMSFPAGKNKLVVLDLTGLFPTDDYRVRIRTNMDVRWDHVFFTTEALESPLRTTTLAPASADFHYRGFSRPYRKGGRYGPHWFDYARVTTESPWLPLEGALTRHGDVLPLLLASDDMYVVMGPGDEATVEFEAAGVPPLPEGWSRDFLLYSDGWVKDADRNTAFGKTVNPLPFHRMSRYPYGTEETYPDDVAHREYLETYQTRSGGRDPRE